MSLLSGYTDRTQAPATILAISHQPSARKQVAAAEGFANGHQLRVSSSVPQNQTTEVGFMVLQARPSQSDSDNQFKHGTDVFNCNNCRYESKAERTTAPRSRAFLVSCVLERPAASGTVEESMNTPELLSNA